MFLVLLNFKWITDSASPCNEHLYIFFSIQKITPNKIICCIQQIILSRNHPNHIDLNQYSSVKNQKKLFCGGSLKSSITTKKHIMQERKKGEKEGGKHIFEKYVRKKRRQPSTGGSGTPKE